VSDNDDRRYRIAVWVVIASEALLFAGLFALYASYRAEYPPMFLAGVRTDVAWMGGTNTFLLLTSSFCIALAIALVRAGRRGATPCIVAVLVLGCGFLALKVAEWSEHLRAGIVPAGSIFFTLYYGMTGLHALHVVAGLALVTWISIRLRRGRVTRERHLSLELVALYWHFVDVVWVFLWPMFYLMKS